jgi:uncharacterized membrane protein
MTTYLLFSWLFGPQLLGVMFLVIWTILHYYPPKKINNLYGYRTTLSQSSQQAWDEANRYSANYMIKLSVVMIVVGAITTTLLHIIPMPAKVLVLATVFLVILSGIAPAILMIVATEGHLEKLFGDK